MKGMVRGIVLLLISALAADGARLMAVLETVIAEHGGCRAWGERLAARDVLGRAIGSNNVSAYRYGR